MTIAILDSGVRLDQPHDDLAENLVAGKSFVGCVSGETACGDGSWGGPAAAFNFHGTATAGLAAAVGGNGIGIVGVAPRAKIMPLKIFNNDGVTIAIAMANAIRWATDNGAQVVR